MHLQLNLTFLPQSRPFKTLQQAIRSGVALTAFVACAAAWAGSGPVIETWQHPSGAKVAWVPSPAIDMLDVRIEFDAGSRRDPTGMVGLAQASTQTGQLGVAATQGQGALNETQIAERWADLGAQWQASAGFDRLTFSLRTLSDRATLDAAIALAALQMAHPRWDAPYAIPLWQRERSSMIAHWQDEQTQPAAVAQRRFQSEVMGQHPYGQEATPHSWQNIRLSDMQAYWQRHVQPCHARISLVGAVDRQQADQLVTQLMEPLQKKHHQACSALLPVADVKPLGAAKHISIAMKTAQAHVLLGQTGYARRDPDYFALMLGNYMLGGGGFASRLMHEVREKRGLTYGVYSSFSPGMHAGPFMVSLQTKPSQADEALAISQQVMRDWLAQGPTEAELLQAKAFMVNGYPLRLDTNRKLVDNVSNVLWHDLPPDYLANWVDAMQRVTLTDVMQAMRRVLQPDRMVSVVVGGAQNP